jgi:hypothetical protein
MKLDPGLDTLRLSDADAELDATFVPEAGMICRSLRHRREELLAQVGGLAEYAHDGHTMGIPLLYSGAPIWPRSQSCQACQTPVANASTRWQTRAQT